MKKPKSIADQLKTLIAEQSLKDEAEVTPNADLVEDLGMDSLDIVELAMALEEKILGHAEILDEDAEKWKTVEDVVSYVETRLSHKEPQKRK